MGGLQRSEPLKLADAVGPARGSRRRLRGVLGLGSLSRMEEVHFLCGVDPIGDFLQSGALSAID